MTTFPIRPATAIVWWLAVRPKTLSLSWVPVLVGASLAWQEYGAINWLASFIACVSAILIQIGTNLHNDVKDWERGIDRADRQGPQRVTAMGWLTVKQVLSAAYAAFFIAFVLGLYLIWIGGLFILLLGVFSIASGLAYTGGPRPIAYGYFGELFVFLFFGLGAVIGTYYLNVGNVSWNSIVLGAVIGLFASAVLIVNNYRDLYSDQAVGKVTLAVRIGPNAIRIVYALSLLLPFIFIAGLGMVWPWLFLTWLALPMAVVLIFNMFKIPPSPACNMLLARTAQLQLIFGLLLSISCLIA